MNEPLEIPIQVNNYNGGYSYHSVLCEKSLYEKFSQEQLCLFNFNVIDIFYILQLEGVDYLLEGEEVTIV